MGVKDLWDILNQVRCQVSLEQLQGKILAIDISTWIYGSITAQGLKGKIGPKPHLRNTFAKISQLLKHGIRPLAVFEGPSPVLKRQTLEKRYSGIPGSKGSSFFGLCVKECQELLKAMGVPFISASGEAEATCAVLNEKGVVDGVITIDGDAFLFGAKTVYKNISGDKQKAGEIECFEALEIQNKLGLDREALVALALLVGCDYTDGVESVGQRKALDLFHNWKNRKALERMRSWRNNKNLDRIEMYEKLSKPAHCTSCLHPGTKVLHRASGCEMCSTDTGCQSTQENTCRCEYHKNLSEYEERKFELRIRRRALADTNFPDERVISAFLDSSDVLSVSVDLERPFFHHLLRACEHCNYNQKTSLQNTLELMVSHDLIDRTQNKETKNCCSSYKCIEKPKTVQGMDMLLVTWTSIVGVPDEYLPVTTEENKGMFLSVFPESFKQYQDEKAAEKAATKAAKKSKGKRGRSPVVGQRTIDSMFKVKKKVPLSARGEKAGGEPSVSGESSAKRSLNFDRPPVPKRIKLDHLVIEDSDPDDLPCLDEVCSF